jgi:hypothetical protein
MAERQDSMIGNEPSFGGDSERRGNEDGLLRPPGLDSQEHAARCREAICRWTPPRRAPKQANACIQEANASLQLATAQSVKGNQAEAIAATTNGVRRAQSVEALLSIRDRSPHAPVLSEMRALSKRIEAVALDQLTVRYRLTGDVSAAHRATKDCLALAISDGDLTARMDASVTVADTYTEGGDHLE